MVPGHVGAWGEGEGQLVVVGGECHNKIIVTIFLGLPFKRRCFIFNIFVSLVTFLFNSIEL